MSGKKHTAKHLLYLIVSNKKSIESIDSSNYSSLINLIDQQLSHSNNKLQNQKYQQIRDKIQEQIDILETNSTESQSNSDELNNYLETENLNIDFQDSQYNLNNNAANRNNINDTDDNGDIDDSSKYSPGSIEYEIFEAQKQKLEDEKALIAQFEAENELFQSECFHRSQGQGFIPSEQLQELKSLYHIFVDQELFDQAKKTQQEIKILEEKEMKQYQTECYQILKKSERNMYNRQRQQMYNLHYFWNAKITKLQEIKDKKLLESND